MKTFFLSSALLLCIIGEDWPINKESLRNFLYEYETCNNKVCGTLYNFNLMWSETFDGRCLVGTDNKLSLNVRLEFRRGERDIPAMCLLEDLDEECRSSSEIWVVNSSTKCYLVFFKQVNSCLVIKEGKRGLWEGSWVFIPENEKESFDVG